MILNRLVKLLVDDQEYSPSLFALIDSGVTGDVMDDGDIYKRLRHPDVEKHILFVGENSWTADRVAPYLLRLDTQEELASWLLENGWGHSWGVFFTSKASEKTLLSHFRRFFAVKAENNRDLFFRFFSPAVLRDFLPLLNEEEARFFFGEVTRFVMEDAQGVPLVFDRPEGVSSSELDPHLLVTSKRSGLAASWQRNLLEQHMGEYREQGFEIKPAPGNNALDLKDAAGTRTRLAKTETGVSVTTGENRIFQFDLTTCKNPSQVIDPAGNIIGLDVQERENMLFGIRMENGRNSWVFDYDEKRHLKSILYPDRTESTCEHDSYGNLRKFTDRNGNSSEFELDKNERLVRITDAGGHYTRFSHEDHMAPARIEFADGKVFGFEYSDDDMLKRFSAGNATIAEYSLDKETGWWEIGYTDGSRTRLKEEDGRIRKAENEAGTLEFTYDDQGGILSETFNGKSTTYKRGETGYLESIITSDGWTTTIGRDCEQRVKTIRVWTGEEIKIGYSACGALASISYPNGVELHQESAASGLPKVMNLASPSTPEAIFNKNFTRDQMDRVTRIRDGENQTEYTYDLEGRLVESKDTATDRCEKFTLDAKGNRLKDNTGKYSVSGADRLHQYNSTDFAYDAVGNLTEGTCPQGSATFSWTAGNRLKSASVKNKRVSYTYDPLGRRVEKRLGKSVTRYEWAGAQLIREVEITGSKTNHTEYLYFPGTPVLLAIRRNDRIFYAHFGHRYETLCLTASDGSVVWQAEYDAFGNASIVMGDDIHQPFRLCGQYHDAETGLHYSAARYYDPQLGRYLSLDPLFREGGGENFYVYCNQDPVNHIDPTGEFIFCAMLIGAAIGAAVGAGLEAWRQNHADEGYDGLKIAKAALLGGAIGAVGGGVGAAVEAAVAAGASGTAMAAGTLTGMGTSGFLAGTAGSVAEQCAQAAIIGNGISPLEMTKQALTDGVIGAGISVVTFGVGGFAARRLKKAAVSAAEKIPTKPIRQLASRVKEKARKLASKVKSKGAKKNGRSNEFCVKDPVNPITGEVVLTQTDFELPWRLPLAWTRHYGSQSNYDGLLGLGWQSPADSRLEIDTDGLVTFFDGSAKAAVFPELPENEAVLEVADGAVLDLNEESYLVRLKSGWSYRFAKDFINNSSPVMEIAGSGGRRLHFIRQAGQLVEIRCGDESVAVECEFGRIVQMSHKDRPLVRYNYRDNELTAAMDPLGHAKHFDYESGRLIRHADKNNLSFHYRYDEKGRCVHTHGDNGLYGCDLEYLPYQRCTRTIDIPGGQVTSFFYDKDNLPLKVQDPTGAETCYEYDELGRVVKVIDPLERITEYEYDQSGNVVGIIRPDQSRMAFVYEENRPVQILDPNDDIWEQRFDEQGRLVEKISPLGHSTSYVYDRKGDLVGVTDPGGRSTTFSWDDSGLIQSVTAPGGATTRYRHDLLGNIVEVIDPAGRISKYIYDGKSRLLTAISPTGLRQSFAWDNEDNLLLHTDAAGRATRFEYTGVNEIARRINPDGTSVQYHYDNEERLTGVTNEKGQTYRFAYDDAGRVASKTDYFGHSHHYSYDAAGQLIKSIDPLEQTISYNYDPAGRLTEKLFESDERECFHWDAVGNLIGFETPVASFGRLFDSDGRLIGEKGPEFEVNYTFDPAGNLTERSTSCGNTIAYGYDDRGAVNEIRINDNELIRFNRDTLGRITGEQLGEKLSRISAYDDEGHLVHQRTNSSATMIERWYDYDPVGQLTSRKDSAKGTMSFTYDPMGRIVKAIDPMGRVDSFNYDPAGDLLEHLPQERTSRNTKDLREARYKNRTYRFDPAGNLFGRLQNGELTRFYWDEQNRLNTVRTGSDETIRMTYDALGRRVQKSVNGERTFFGWDGDVLLAEKFEDQPAREYVYYPGTFEPLAVIDGSEVYYYHNDVNGLPQELTRANGDIVWSASYDAMGRIEQILVDEVVQPLRFQGQYYDPEIDLCYNRYRYFDPHICSFISQDPLGLAAGENVYAYAPNVWGWVDPLGLACEDISNKGTATIRQYENGYPEGHFTVEIDDGVNKLHTEQVITSSDYSTTTIRRVPPSEPPVTTKVIEIPDASGAMNYQKSLIGKDLGPYDVHTNSCLSHAVDVIEKGGGQTVSKTRLGLAKFLKKQGFGLLK